MTDEREKMSSHQRDLARRLGAYVDGEEMIDVIEVCAKMVVFGLYKSFETPETRLHALELLFEAMRKDLSAGPRKKEPLQ